MKAVSCFTADQFRSAHDFLAAQVATMMGRKFEEGDWSSVYCAAKGIPATGWSNLAIDVMYGNLGVEHKMLCAGSHDNIKSLCGLSRMHPAGTRAIRIPDEEDPTKAARDVLKQYGALIRQRAEFIRILYRYNHAALSREQAATLVMELYGMGSRQSALRLIPDVPKPIEKEFRDAEPDIRTGWLLWQASLREFLYFEEPTIPPKPEDYYAEWADSGGGRRKRSRNLWVYDKKSKEKKFSITTEAGAKIQPYFTVPPPDDPNLYYFIVQGELVNENNVRVWLTQSTASFMKLVLGDLPSDELSRRILEQKVKTNKSQQSAPPHVFHDLAVPVLISVPAYDALKASFSGVSDEHMMQQFLRSVSASSA